MKFIIILFLFPHFAFADILYSLGTYVPYFQKVQTSSSGAKQFIDLTPYLGVGTHIKLSDSHYFSPEFALAYYINNPTKTKRKMYFFHYNFSYFTSPKFILRYGLTTHWYQISGEGGTVTLRNGDGYSDFSAPSTTRTSYFTTLNIGLESFFKPLWSIRFDLNTMSFLNPKNIGFNYIFTFNMYR